MAWVTHSLWLKFLGLSLLNSLWQMALAWLLYILITFRTRRFTAAKRHVLALLLLGGASAWFLTSLMGALLDSSRLASGSGYAFPKNFIGDMATYRQGFQAMLPWISSVYLLVLVGLVIRHTGLYFHLRKIRRSEGIKFPPRFRLFAEELAARMGIQRRISLRLSGRVSGPLTIGVFKPIILIPLAMISQLSPDQVEALILHELAHIRRQDFLINLMISWAGLIFFFNPFARALIEAIRKERENCCDDLVMQFRYDPSSYARALLSLEQSRLEEAELALGAAGRKPKLLLERVKRITGQTIPAKAVGYQGLALFLLSGILFLALISGQNLPETGIKIKNIFRTEKVNTPQEAVDIVLTSNKANELPAARRELHTKKAIAASIAKPARPKNPAKNELTEESLGQGADLILPAGKIESRDYSIVLDEERSAPKKLADDFPYVPNLSYSYRLAEDSNRLRYLSSDLLAGESLLLREEALGKIRQIDWGGIDDLLIREGKSKEAEELDHALRDYLIADAGIQKKNSDQSHIPSDPGSRLLRSLTGLKNFGVGQTELMEELRQCLHRDEFLKKGKPNSGGTEEPGKQPVRVNRRPIVYI